MYDFYFDLVIGNSSKDDDEFSLSFSDLDYRSCWILYDTGVIAFEDDLEYGECLI